MKKHVLVLWSALLWAAVVAAVVQFSVVANAAKLVILTNQPGAAKAREIKLFIATIEPFKYLKASELNVEIQEIDAKNEGIECHPLFIQYNSQEILSLKYWSEQNHIALTSADLDKYRKGYTITRTLDCNKPAIVTLGARFGADQVMYVVERNELGGSGGDVPVVSTASRKTVAVHEWLHTFGFGDEYAYSREEAPAYCTQSLWPNVAIFKDEPPYASNADAIARHGAQIPWLATLGAHPDLVSGTALGSSNHNTLGLFPAKTCSQLPALKSWKANIGTTIMESIDYNYIPKTFWPKIFSSLRVSPARMNSLMKLSEEPVAKRWMPEFKGSPDEGHI